MYLVLKLFFIINMIIISHQSLLMKCQSFKNRVSNSNQTIMPDKYKERVNVITRSFVRNLGDQLIFGRAILIRNSFNVIKVLQANNDNSGCANHIRSLPSRTRAMAKNCEIVINAGLFNTQTGQCYGNVINDEKLFVNFHGIRTAHFGVKKDHSLFFGYLSEEEVMTNQFISLVGGAIWLLRNGKNVVNESVLVECAEVQETGSMAEFASVRSARSAIGAFANGTVVIMQIGGRTGTGGINLFDMADLLAGMGVVAAINLDGGGSSTVVINGTVASYPSDQCGPWFTCERNVTTVLCVLHDPPIARTVTIHQSLLVVLIAALCVSVTLLLVYVTVHRILEYRRRTLSNSYFHKEDFLAHRALIDADDHDL